MGTGTDLEDGRRQPPATCGGSATGPVDPKQPRLIAFLSQLDLRDRQKVYLELS